MRHLQSDDPLPRQLLGRMAARTPVIKTVEASRVDPTWAAPTVSHTGYAFAALFYFVFCWGMSRYSIGVERRLASGHNR